MSKDFEELDFQKTALGDLLLRRRRLLSLDTDVYEVKLGRAFLMSSLFHEVEVALARLGLEGLGAGSADVLVGGLGLGYTAVAALEHPALRSLLVIEALAPVISWHQRALVPLGAKLTGDGRVRLACGDFFALAESSGGFDESQSGRRFDAVLLDIDHSPRHVLHPPHASFYRPEGLRGFARQLSSAGVFALWSDDPPDDEFLLTLETVFEQARAEVVSFPNPLTEQTSSSTVYVARRPQ